MRIVADTNTVVSGLLWHGPPRQILEAARAGKIELFTSEPLLAELHDVLGRAKFITRLAFSGTTSEALTIGYRGLATVIEPATIGAVVHDDPDDDAVLACAVAASASMIVSGDKHLLNLASYQGIPILRASDALVQILRDSP